MQVTLTLLLLVDQVCRSLSTITTSPPPTTTPPTPPEDLSWLGWKQCHERCSWEYGGFCLPNGRCLCISGFAGVNQQFNYYYGYEEADYCYPVHQPSVCHVRCGSGIYHATGTCMADGRCLCWYGWTGANAIYVSLPTHIGGLYVNRIIADYCSIECHYTHHYRNTECLRITSLQ